MRTAPVYSLIIALLGCQLSVACTIFTATKGDTVLVGNNEDFYPPGPKMWVQPASEGKYGWIGFGFTKDYPRWPQGGVNDQGLFYDWASLPIREDVRFPADRPFFQTYSAVKMLEECATVDEAIALYQEYSARALIRAHIIVADKHGASAIIEWGKDDLAVIRKTGDYQLVTNFNITDPRLAGGYPCRRYNTADRMLSQGDVSVAHFASILRAVHQRGRFHTQYSNVYDLSKGVIYVYHEHYFYEHIKIDVEEELKKGSHCYELPSLFAKLALLEPVNDEKVASTSVTFRWKGGARDYRLYCSTERDFANCTPVQVSRAGWKSEQLAASDGQQTTTTLGHEPKPEEMSSTVESLSPGTTYYWKIVAKGQQGFDCESTVKTFKIVE